MTEQNEAMKSVVRDTYADIAERAAKKAEASGGCAPASSCCGTGDTNISVEEVAAKLGYDPKDLEKLPKAANLGLGCGNPQALASLKEGEVVVDLGSGAGVDCFIAAQRVGASGRVLGVDMTPQMLVQARKNRLEGDFPQVEFLLGEIEHLPIGDGLVDVIMSNCVINLSTEKDQVFRECFRVLKPGGRLAISDVVATAVLPDEIRQDPGLLSGCIAGAAVIGDLVRWMQEAGFEDAKVEPWDESRSFIKDWAPGQKVEDYVVSASITARKPGASGCC